MKNIKTIKGLQDIIANYDLFILDQWGVMHDGFKGYKKAILCINELIKKKKILIIISNSSKRKESTTINLPRLGFNYSHFKSIMTSGEMIWQFLNNYHESNNLKLGKKCFHIFDDSKEDGKKYTEGLNNFIFVKDVREADFILGCTPFANSKILDFVPILDIAVKKNLTFVCANPDFDTVTSNQNINQFCIGSVSELYKNMGGKNFFLGKPSVKIYNDSIKNFPEIDKSRILAVGDSMFHDIKGANDFGIDSLLITSTGIHQAMFDKVTPSWSNKLNKLSKVNIKPTFICSEFTF